MTAAIHLRSLMFGLERMTQTLRFIINLFFVIEKCADNQILSLPSSVRMCFTVHVSVKTLSFWLLALDVSVHKWLSLFVSEFDLFQMQK